MRTLVISTLLVGSMLMVPTLSASAATAHGGGGGGPMSRLLGLSHLTAEAGSKVNGAVVLQYNPKDGKIAVIIQVSGLAPHSAHPAHIHQGASCSANGPVIYPLPTLMADAHGTAIATTSIDARVIPASGWYVNVHQGPGLAGAQFTPIGCGIVRRASAAASLDTANGSETQGIAVMARTAAGTDVVVVADNLTPGSSHPEHIHQGSSCSANGPVIYPLPPLVADDNGIAVSAATLQTTSIPAIGWYINIHKGPGLAGAQFTPIACGTVSYAS